MRTVSVEAKYDRQSGQEAIYHVQQSRQEERDCGQSRWKRNMTDSLSRKLLITDSSLGRRQEIADSLGGRQI